MASSFQLRAYLTWWLDAVDGHSLHSPFLFDLYNAIAVPAREENRFPHIENIRDKILRSREQIVVSDLGAGSVHRYGTLRNVCDIARTSLTPPKFSRIYRAMIQRYQCRDVIELGTSLGINTLYLADIPGTRVVTFEGAAEVARLASENFSNAGKGNIRLVEGDISRTLRGYLSTAPDIDFVFMDANHRYEPTCAYFETIRPHLGAQSIVVIDDIHYSGGMQRAWDEIRRRSDVSLSVDLFRAGILFFDPSLNKQHVVIQV